MSPPHHISSSRARLLWPLLVAALLAALLPPAAAEAADGHAAPGERLFGPDRVATAVALSAAAWTDASTVVIARSDDFADALAAGLLADRLDAPLLLTARAALSPTTEAEIRRLGADRAIIVGGTAAVGTAVADRLREVGARVDRIAGSDRFHTAVAVSEAIESAAGPALDGVLVARGAHATSGRAWPDALAAGAFAALDDGMAMLLTADALPAATRDRAAALDLPVSVIGGSAAVGDAQLQDLGTVATSVDRIAGRDRYGTSRAVADTVLGRLDATRRPLVVASGANYPDALAAAAFVGRVGGVLLLVPPAGFAAGDPMTAWLESHRDRFSTLVAAGGPGALGDAVLAQVAAASGTRAPDAQVDRIALPRFSDMGATWQPSFSIGYGEAEALLGTAPGGDDDGMVGPEAGAQGPDGTWWILDGAKQRVARYDAQGRYLGQVVLGPELLRDGVYMPYDRPRVLADGTFIASAMTSGGTTEVLRIQGERAELVLVPAEVLLLSDDGTLLYGLLDDGSAVSVDVASRRVAPVPALRGRDGRPFTIRTSSGQLRFRRPDAGQDRTVPVVAAQPPGGPVGYGVQVETGGDGTLHLFFTGVPLADERQDVGGYTRIRPDGTVAPAEPTRTPFTPANLFSTASNLSVRPGTDEVSMYFVAADGLHVYHRR